MKIKLGQICEVVSGGLQKQMLKNIGMENLIGLPAEINDNDYIISDTKRKITQ